MNGDVYVADETAQRQFIASLELYTRTTCCGQWVDQKNADAMSTDDLDDDTVYYVNSDLQLNIDKLVGLLESDSESNTYV